MVKTAQDLGGPERRPALFPVAGKFFPARAPWLAVPNRAKTPSMATEFRRSVIETDKTLDRFVSRSAYKPVATKQIDVELAVAAANAVIEALSEDQIAAFAPSPTALPDDLARQLAQGGLDVGPADLEEQAAVLVSRALPRILLKQSVVSRASAAQLLGVSLATLDNWIHHRALLEVDEGIPTFQFCDDFRGLLPGLGEILSILPVEMDAVAVEQWFSAPSEDFWIEDGPASIRDWLGAGGSVERVLDAARSVLIS